MPTKLRVSTGASGVRVTLPQSAGQTTAKISAGVSGIEVMVPQGVAAQIRANRGIGGLSIDESRFPKVEGNLYRSRDHSTAANRVDLELDTGIGGLTVR